MSGTDDFGYSITEAMQAKGERFYETLADIAQCSDVNPGLRKKMIRQLGMVDSNQFDLLYSGWRGEAHQRALKELGLFPFHHLGWMYVVTTNPILISDINDIITFNFAAGKDSTAKITEFYQAVIRVVTPLPWRDAHIVSQVTYLRGDMGEGNVLADGSAFHQIADIARSRGTEWMRKNSNVLLNSSIPVSSLADVFSNDIDSQLVQAVFE